MELTTDDLLLVCAYVVATLAVGMWPTRIARANAFLISGRQLGGVSSGLTIAASKIGAGAIVTYAALIFAFGYQAIWMYVGYIVGYLVFYIFASHIHAESKSKEYLTIADYFRTRVGAGSAIAVGILTTASLFGWVLTNFLAGGKILAHVSGLSPSTATCAMALVVVSYLLVGGFNAVVRTDVIQYLSLLVVLVVLAVVAIGMPKPEHIASFEPMSLGQVIGLFVTGLFFPMGSAELWQRVYATENARSLRRAILFASGSFVILAGALSVIFVTLAYLGSPNPGVDQDIAIFDIVGSRLGVGFAGIWFIALVSAIASSADTFVFTTSASSILDIGERLFGVDAKKRVTRIRIALVVCTALATATAILIGNIVDVTFLFAGMTMGLGAVVLVVWVYRSLPSWVVVTSCAVGTGASLAQAAIAGITVTTAVVNLGLALIVSAMGAVFHAVIQAIYRHKVQVAVTAIKRRYPTFCAVAKHPKLDADLEAAVASSAKKSKGLWESYNACEFKANELTFWLSIHELGGCADSTADVLEQDLKAIVDILGLEEARRAYRSKLLINSYKTFQDVRYEIGATAGALEFFDAGTITLEAGIGRDKKNSDIKGTKNGQDYRLEVRVVHDEWPPSIDPELSEQMEEVDIPVGYCVSLQFPVNQETADEVCRIIKAAYEASLVTEFSSTKLVQILDFEYYYNSHREELVTSSERCPIRAVNFLEEREIRLVMPPVHTRSMVDPQEREFFDNPEGVHVFSGYLTDKRTYKDLPLSTRIAQAVQDKVCQCEEGVCNIVVLGTPSLMADHSVDDALTGPLAATYVKNPDNTFSSDGLVRKSSGMFVPAQYSECRENLVDPYRIISAVWHVRLGFSKPQSRVIRNPNATVPISEEDADTLASMRPSS